MNPLLSLSFSSSGAVSAGVEPVVPGSGALLNENSAAGQFSRLLDQSGEQQSADRQSIAGFSIGVKGKRIASMEGRPLNQPDNAIAPIIAPEAELLLVDDNEPANLLGLLDLASQTRLQLSAESAEKAATKADRSDPASGDETVSPDGKKINKGDWFILPVNPETAAAKSNLTESSGITDEQAKQDMTDATAAKLAAGQSDAKAGDKKAGQNAEYHSSQTSVSGESIADGTGGKASQPTNNNSPDGLIQQILTKQDAADDVEKNQANAVAAGKSSAQEDADASKHGQHAASDAVKLATPASGQSAAVLSEQASMPSQVQAETGGFAPKADGSEQASANERSLFTNAATERGGMPKTTSATKVIQPAEAINIAADPQADAVTIFTNSDKMPATIDDAKPGSALASAAMVAESVSAKQQQRNSATDSLNQAKQALIAETDSGAGAPGGRTDSSLNGFTSTFSQGGQSQTEAAIARMEAAMVSASRQSAAQTTAPSGNKSVAEQLKQVHLLAENAAGQLKERINVMVRQNIHVAEIRLDPAELGQMQIRVNLQQEQASVQFIVQQQHAKELLEQQMPRLREMLQQQGIQLGEGQVQQQRQGDNQASTRRDGNAGSAEGGSEQPAEDKATAVQLEVKLSERIVDYYA